GRVRFHLGPDLDHYWSRHNEPAFRRGSRVLSTPKESNRRGPHGPDRGDAAHPGPQLVGDFFLENGDQLDLREVFGSDCLDGFALHAHHLSLSPGFIGIGRASRYLASESRWLLRRLCCHVPPRYFANSHARWLVSSSLVSPVSG